MDIYPIAGFNGVSLAIMARPRAGDWLEDEVSRWKARGIDAVISLLESHEVRELGLTTEPQLCAAHGISFHSFPIPDRGAPASTAALDSFLTPLVAQMRAGRSIAIHCRAGIGRSALVAACMLIRAGVPYPQTFPAISKARGVRVPDTEAQEAWVRQYSV